MRKSRSRRIGERIAAGLIILATLAFMLWIADAYLTPVVR